MAVASAEPNPFVAKQCLAQNKRQICGDFAL